MALFNKIFANSKKKSTNNGVHSQQQQQQHHTTISPFPFTEDQVRIVLYRECDLRGTKLLFDSDAFMKLTKRCQKADDCSRSSRQKPEDSGHFYELSNGLVYKYTRQTNPTTDNNLNEQIFGSVALAFRGTTFKVHWLQNPPRIMCSQVFLAPIQPVTGQSPRNSQQTTRQSTEATSLNSLSLSLCINNDLGTSCPLDVPSETGTNVNTNGHHSTDDSGYSGTDPWNATSTTSSRVSNHSSIASVFSDGDNFPRKYSIDASESVGLEIYSNHGSIQRRISRHLSTSLENRTTTADFIGHLGEFYASNGGTIGSELNVSKVRRNSEIVERGIVPDVRKRNAVSGEILPSRRNNARRPRLGIAVCFKIDPKYETEMKLFCSEHMLMLESMINRLRLTVESAYASRQKFLYIMLAATHDISSWLVDLFTAPRIANPLWLSLSSTYIRNATQLALGFMKDLNTLMNVLDTKETNFFISRLLTGVLTCHLGWVNTIAPITANKRTERIITDTSPDTLVGEDRINLAEVNKSHPYNALWAQLGDLHGAIGSPLRIAKTILYGSESHTKIIERILSILTYFIRCGEIKRQRLLSQIHKEHIRNLMKKSKDSPTVKKSNVVTKPPTHPNSDSKPKLMRRSNTQMANLSLMAQLTDSSSENIPSTSTSSNNSIPFKVDIDEENTLSNDTFSSSNLCKKSENNVVFVLGGDNEELIGLKESQTSQATPNGAIKKSTESCMRQHKHKKHSGVKFNFEQYPQIATNYMKNKNLEMNNYEFFDKGLKMEIQWKMNFERVQNNMKQPSTSTTESEVADDCECCTGMGAHFLQTPSNASELEFSNDDLTTQTPQQLPSLSKGPSTATPLIIISEPSCSQASVEPKPLLNGHQTFAPLDENREVNIIRDRSNGLKLIELPLNAESNEVLQLELHEPTLVQKLVPGFTSSLFIGISNHYISDMVLQGIVDVKNATSNFKWEDALRQDLVLAARCITLEQTPTENIAIVANVDKWDVRLLSSNSSYLTSPSTNNRSFGLVGMSQLVSSLLETVQIMWNSGASPFQCLSLIESKLQEIYIHSEALAEFLLTTEFCSLNMLTTALELTDNDIPLLLAVASIHSPQVTKKYGVSSR